MTDPLQHRRGRCGLPARVSAILLGDRADMAPLDADKAALLRGIVDELRAVPRMAALALGGSYARGTAQPDSDLDLGLYYREATPFAIAAIRELAGRLNDTPDPVLTDFYKWGCWVNGGSWLTIRGQRVDFLYRNLDQLEQVIAQCQAGDWEQDYAQQLTHDFVS